MRPQKGTELDILGHLSRCSGQMLSNVLIAGDVFNLERNETTALLEGLKDYGLIKFSTSYGHAKDNPAVFLTLRGHMVTAIMGSAFKTIFNEHSRKRCDEYNLRNSQRAAKKSQQNFEAPEL